MTWMRCCDGYRLDPIAEGSPAALVVLLQDRGAAAGLLMPVAARWAQAVPATAFVALDGGAERDDKAERAGLDRAMRRLGAQLEQHLHFWRLDASRLVLVGFGYGATLALNMLVRHQGWRYVGVLGFGARLIRPVPRIVRGAHKVRLIACPGDNAFGSLRDDVAVLTARGIDTRGVVLSGSGLSPEAIRHGGAYLVELVATAQRGARFTAKRTVDGPPSGRSMQAKGSRRRSWSAL